MRLIAMEHIASGVAGEKIKPIVNGILIKGSPARDIPLVGFAAQISLALKRFALV